MATIVEKYTEPRQNQQIKVTLLYSILFSVANLLVDLDILIALGVLQMKTTFLHALQQPWFGNIKIWIIPRNL